MKPLMLYIHIPFCVRKCLYCDFLSFADHSLKNEYLKVLSNEIKTLGTTAGKGRTVTSIFIGGGTPSLLSVSELSGLMNDIRSSFNVSQDAEISMECNPGTLGVKHFSGASASVKHFEKCCNEACSTVSDTSRETFSREKNNCETFNAVKHTVCETLQGYREAGINRLSIGLQSDMDKHLRTLGRIHDLGDFEITYSAAREAGFENINIDLMSAIPGQTVQDWKDTLNHIVSLSPEHISAYSLIIEEGTPYYDHYVSGLEFEDCKLPSLVDEDDERKMYHITKDILLSAGFARYEISNYAKPGYECKHNIGYWTGVEYLGLGLGAASMLAGYRFKNTSDLKTFVTYWSSDTSKCKNDSKNEFCPADYAIYEEVEKNTVESAISEYMILGLRLTKGISVSGFESNFGRKLAEMYGTAIDNHISEGLLTYEGDRLHLTDKGLDLANYVMKDFL